MNIDQNILMGVVTGVLTAVLLFLVKEFWSKTLIPLYQKVKYQGADVSGSWFAEFPSDDGSVSKFSLTLNQNAHNITGSMHFVFTSSEKNYTIDYNLSGEYWEGYLQLNCRSKDRKRYSHASSFLKLINGGTGLLGSFSFRNVMTDNVDMQTIGFDRN